MPFVWASPSRNYFPDICPSRIHQLGSFNQQLLSGLPFICTSIHTYIYPSIQPIFSSTYFCQLLCWFYQSKHGNLDYPQKWRLQQSLCANALMLGAVPGSKSEGMEVEQSGRKTEPRRRVTRLASASRKTAPCSVVWTVPGKVLPNHCAQHKPLSGEEGQMVLWLVPPHPPHN